MTLNGWQRLLIVLAAAWALGVIIFAAAELQLRQGQPGDGFFTCRRPVAPTLSTWTYWDRFCGLFPQPNGAAELDLLFADISDGNAIPADRYLNAPRFVVVLSGPLVLAGLGILAMRWIVKGFRPPATSGGAASVASTDLELQPSESRKPASPQAAENHLQAWLDRLPRRWARNAAIAGGGLAALSVFPFLSSGDGGFIAALLAAVLAIALSLSGAGYLCGLWARYSLKAPLLLSPTAALGRINSNWMTGAILLGALVLTSDLLFGWRKTTPLFERGINAGDLGYLTGFFGTWALVGYVTAVASRRGLRKAIEVDSASASARPERPRVPVNSLQHESPPEHQAAYSSRH